MIYNIVVKIFIIFIILMLISLPGLPNSFNSPENQFCNEESSVKNILRNKYFLNSVALGIITSSMGNCGGENADSKVFKIAGSIFLKSAISEFKQAKLNQKKLHEYEVNSAGVANDAQKLHLTGEFLKTNKKILAVLNDKLESEKFIRNALMVAENLARKDLIRLNKSLKTCEMKVREAAFMPIAVKSKLDPTKRMQSQGRCHADYNESMEVANACMPNPQPQVQQGAGMQTGQMAQASAQMAAQASAQMLAQQVAMSKMVCAQGFLEVSKNSRIQIMGELDCPVKCKEAANQSVACRQGMAMLRDKRTGVKRIQSFSRTMDPSSMNASHIVRLHNDSLGQMYRMCKRDEVIEELSRIRSRSKDIDSLFEEIKSSAMDTYQNHGGTATSEHNRKRTEESRGYPPPGMGELEGLGEEFGSAGTPSEDVFKDHHYYVKQGPDNSSNTSSKDDPFKNYKITVDPKAKGKPSCGDDAATACKEYSKTLLTSLNACTNTLTLPKMGSGYMITVGGSLGLEKCAYDQLKLIHKNMVDTIDPLLSTLNKRVMAYQTARDIVDLSITNTKKNIEQVKKQIASVSSIKTVMDEASIKGPISIKAIKVKKKFIKDPLKRRTYRRSVGGRDLVTDLENTFAPFDGSNTDLSLADDITTRAALDIAKIGNSVAQKMDYESVIKEKMKEFNGNEEDIKKSNQMLVRSRRDHQAYENYLNSMRKPYLNRFLQSKGQK